MVLVYANNLDDLWCHKVDTKCNIWNIYVNTKSTGLKFCRVELVQELHLVIVVMMSPYIAIYSLEDLYLPKMKNALFVAPESNRLSRACAVHICSHPLNEQHEQITLLEGGKLWFYLLNKEGLQPIVLPWKCHNRHIMELCDNCNNCTKSSTTGNHHSFFPYQL